MQDSGAKNFTSIPHFYANMYHELLVLLSGISLCEIEFDSDKDYTKDEQIRTLINEKLRLQFAKAFEEDANLSYLGPEKSLLITLLCQFASFFPQCSALRNP